MTSSTTSTRNLTLLSHTGTGTNIFSISEEEFETEELREETD